MIKTTFGNGCRSLLMLAMVGMTAVSSSITHAKSSADLRSNCNAEAKADGLTGDGLRQAITRCIRQKSETGSSSPILAKVSECNRRAGNISGDARTSFMDTCLKNN